MTHEDMIREGLRILTKEAFDNSKAHGFHDDKVEQALDPVLHDREREENRGRMLMVRLMLLVTEVAEAAEEYRADGLETDIRYDDKGKPVGIAIELADLAIRLGDMCGSLGIDLGRAVEVKMAYNRGRPMMHGKKL